MKKLVAVVCFLLVAVGLPIQCDDGISQQIFRKKSRQAVRWEVVNQLNELSFYALSNGNTQLSGGLSTLSTAIVLEQDSLLIEHMYVFFDELIASDEQYEPKDIPLSQEKLY
jgi:hypothetical protein